MKLIQLNAWTGRLFLKMVPFLQSENADFVTLQEVFKADSDTQFPDRLERLFNCAELLREAVGYEHMYFSPTWAMEIDHRQVHYGNAILSHHPFVSKETVFTNHEFNPDYRSDSHERNIRNLQLTTIELGSKLLHLLNHHGYWVASPVGNETTIEKMKVVAEKVSNLDGPIILAGDLNVTAASPAMRTFDGLLTDLTATHNLHTTLSELGKVTGVACDHILVNDTVKVISFGASNELVSDHKALVMEFEL